jgi:hypothetical protein
MTTDLLKAFGRIDELEAINARWSAVARAVGELYKQKVEQDGSLICGGYYGLEDVERARKKLEMLEVRLEKATKALRTGDLPAIEKALGIGGK